MKKKFYRGFTTIFISIFLILTFSSCTTKNTVPNENDIDVFNNNEVMSFVDSYMNHLFNREYDEAKAMHLKSNDEAVNNEDNLIIMGWKTEEVSNAVEGAMVKVMVCKSSQENVVALLEQYNINVEKTDDGYKIIDVKISKEEESFKEGENLRIRQKNNIKTNLLIDKSGLPQYIYPKDDKEKIKETQISPQSQFALSSFNYSGGKVAVSSEDKDAFISIIKLEEALKVQGKTYPMDNDKESEGKEPKNNVREIPIGKEIIPLDIIMNAKVNLLTFSKDEKFLVVQYKNNKGATRVRCYNSDSGDTIAGDLLSKLPVERYDLFFKDFDESNLYIRAIERGYNNVENKVVQEEVKINLKDFKIEK